jgi:hypothetical protein
MVSLLRSEKIARNHIIERALQVERERDEARTDAARQSTALCAARDLLCDAMPDLNAPTADLVRALVVERDSARILAGELIAAWALQNNANATKCDCIDLHLHPDRGYKSFPDDERLSKFDPPDRKFVAVAVAHENHPPILQAADSKWLGWAPALSDHGIEVDFLCPDDIQRFRDKKSGK